MEAFCNIGLGSSDCKFFYSIGSIYISACSHKKLLQLSLELFAAVLFAKLHEAGNGPERGSHNSKLAGLVRAGLAGLGQTTFQNTRDMIPQKATRVRPRAKPSTSAPRMALASLSGLSSRFVTNADRVRQTRLAPAIAIASCILTVADCGRIKPDF